MKDKSTVDVSKLHKWQQELWKYCEQKLSSIVNKDFKEERYQYFEQGLGHLFTIVHYQILYIGTEHNPYISMRVSENNLPDLESIILNYSSLDYFVDNILQLISIFGFISIKARKKNLKLRDPLEEELYKEADIVFKLNSSKDEYNYDMALEDANNKKGFFSKMYFEFYKGRLSSNYKNFRQDIKREQSKSPSLD